jgi:SPP1 family predicted phage head-tail adaptor
MRPGDLRQVITIQQQTVAQGPHGQPLNGWSTFLTARAAAVRTPGREVFASASRNDRVPTQFRMRYRDGITPAMRVAWDGRIFNIISVTDPDGFKTELLLTTEELVGET